MPEAVEDDAIRSVVARLGREHPSGGTVIERAAILAEGADCATITRWIVAHGGTAEAPPMTSVRHGLHGARPRAVGTTEDVTPSRFVLPAGALDPGT